MRRILVPAVLLVALSACSATATPPKRTIALEQVIGGVGADVASARQTVLDFLDAYANASADDGRELASLAQTEQMSRWAHWLAVQDAGFPGKISGKVELGALQFAEAVPAQGSLASAVVLEATISFEYVPEDGKPFPLKRVLDGPVTLFLRGPGDWGVVDITRDGQSLADAIQILDGLTGRQNGLKVNVDSLFTFSPSWSFNVVVKNAAGSEIRFAPEEAELLPPKGERGEPLRGQGATAPLMSIPDGAKVEGSVNFEAPPDPAESTLRLPFHVGRRLVVFDFLIKGIVTQAQTPSPTASAPVQ